MGFCVRGRTPSARGRPTASSATVGRWLASLTSIQAPHSDRPHLRRLTEAPDAPGVALAALIGSQAAGSPGPLADVDIAVWLDPSLDADERLEARLSLGAAAQAVVGDRRVDLVILDDAPPLLQNRAGRGRVTLVERDPRTRVRLEADALVRYLDTQPLRSEFAAGGVRPAR